MSAKAAKRKSIDKKLLGERLKRLMDNHKETTYSLAAKFNLSPPTISRYTRGEMQPKMTTIRAFAEYFNVNPKWLTGESSSIFIEEILDDLGESVTLIPIYKSIKYDLPLFSNKKTDESIVVPMSKMRQWGAVLALRMEDEAMSPILEKGDAIVVKLDPTLKSHKLAALHVDKGDLIIRKVKVKDNQVILQPANLDYDAEVYNTRHTDIQMIGSVVFREHVVTEDFTEETLEVQEETPCIPNDKAESATSLDSPLKEPELDSTDGTEAHNMATAAAGE